MKRIQPPRRGTPAFAALTRVHALGGAASAQQLLGAVQSHFTSMSRLERMVLRPLAELGFIKCVKDGVRITRSGRDYIESDAAPSSSGYAKISHVGRLPEMKPLKVPAHLRLEETRPGAMDYRQYPSLIGGKRVPFAVGTLAGREDDPV